MSSVILCRRNQAQKPFYLEDLSLHLYNLEEISYFIQENIDLAQPVFMQQPFLEWVSKELIMPSLAQRLELYWRRKNVMLFMESLLQACGYHTASEVEEICKSIHEFQKKSPMEQKKMRADRLLEEERYVAAVQAYQRMLTMEEMKQEKSIFKGQIWNNLGTAYARMFLFEEAMTCYERASTYQDTDQIGKEYWAACYLAYGEKETRKRMAAEKFPEEQIDVFLDFQKKEEQPIEDMEIKKLYELRKKGEINTFYEQADAMMKVWKADYMQRCVF